MADTPHTPPEQAICGIGTEYIGPTYDGVAVKPYHENTAASHAGIKYGDVIVSAKETGNSEYSPVKTYDDFIALRGLLGSTVDVEIRDAVSGEVRSMHLTRRPYMSDPEALITPVDLEPESCGLPLTIDEAPQHGLSIKANILHTNGNNGHGKS